MRGRVVAARRVADLRVHFGRHDFVAAERARRDVNPMETRPGGLRAEHALHGRLVAAAPHSLPESDTCPPDSR